MYHENLVSVPPDGGWGWLIIFVSFYGLVLIDVPSMGFQVVLPFMKDLFHEPVAAVSAVFSIYTLILQIIGPIAGGICNRFGFRLTAIFGSVLMAIGFIPLIFADSYFIFLLLFGGLAGLGASFITLVCNVAPGFWFETKRPMALGIVSSASGFSLFCVPVSEVLSTIFGWRHCFLFWAVLAITMGVLSILLRPPPMIELQGVVNHHNLPARTLTAHDVVNAAGIKKIERIISKNSLVNRKLRRLSENIGVPLMPKYSRVPSRYATMQVESTGCSKCCSCCQCQKLFGSRPLYRKDIFFQGNLDHASELEEVPSATYTLRMTKLPTIQDVKEEVECHFKLPEAMSRAICDMVDFSLFKSWVFLLLVIATLFNYVAIYIPFLQIKRVNKGKMDDRYISLLPVVMGLGLICFRASIGLVLYYFPKISALFVTVVASFMGGLIFLSVPLSYTVPYQFILAFCGGGFPSVITPLRTVVIIEELGLDRLTSCMGILFFVQGVACFIGLPLAELLNEGTGLVYSGIVFSGTCLILSGVSFALIGLVNHMKNGFISATTIVSAAA